MRSSLIDEKSIDENDGDETCGLNESIETN